MSVNRPYWQKRVESAWKEKSIVWLAGVRRVGKTTLTKAWPDALYLNCDLPRIQSEILDPEQFFKSTNSK